MKPLEESDLAKDNHSIAVHQVFAWTVKAKLFLVVKLIERIQELALEKLAQYLCRKKKPNLCACELSVGGQTASGDQTM